MAGCLVPDQVMISSFAQRQEQIELFSEEHVVIFEIVTEQRIGFDEGTTPGHNLGPAVRQEIDG